MERVRAAIPGKGKLNDAGNWKTGDSKTEVKKGGGEEALAKLHNKLADRDRPCYWWAHEKLAALTQAAADS